MGSLKKLRYLLFLILLYFAISAIAHELPALQKARNVLDEINYSWIFLAILFQSGQYIGDGLLSQHLLRSIEIKLSFKDTFRIAAMNVFAAHLLPVGQAGAFATSYYFYQRLGVPAGAIVFLSLAWGIITNLILILLLLVSLSFLPNVSIPIDPSTQSLFMLVALAATLSGLIAFRQKAKTMFWKFAKAKKLTKDIETYVAAFKEYEKDAKREWRQILLGIVGALIYFLSNIATLAFSFAAFGQWVSLPLLTFAYTASLLLGIITLAPAGIGATEATLILVFAQAQIDPAVSLAAILVFRLITFWIPIPAGAISYASLKRKTKVQ